MRRTTFLVVLPIAVAFVAGYSVRKPSRAESATGETFLTSVSHEGPGEGRRNAIVMAAQKVSPAVVSISVIQTRYFRSSPSWGDELFDRYFRDFFPPRIYKQEVQSLGSGFIVNPEGYILTNEHVLRDAEKIRVTLPDGREFDGKIAGKDEVFDIALLKIAGADLPSASLGNSDDLIIGEWAIAIGNPFGYLLEDPKPSVTAGVISAFHRDIKPRSGWVSMYKDMIQTDAAINPGNSGGPLVNAEGKVIGINTFIFTAGGGSEGIGFAIPINAAKKIMEELVQYGEVREVWLGIDVKEPTSELAETIGRREGVLGTDVEKGGTAEQPPKVSEKTTERLGIVVQNITTYTESKLRLGSTRGVVVIEVKHDSHGETAGVEVGDIILTLENREIGDVDDFESAADEAGEEKLSLLVDRKGTKLYLSYTSIW